MLPTAGVPGFFDEFGMGGQFTLGAYGLVAVTLIALGGWNGWQRLAQAGPSGARVRVALPWFGGLGAATLTLQCHLAWRWLAHEGPPLLVALGFALSSAALFRVVWGAGARLGHCCAAALVKWGTPRDLPLGWSLGAALLSFAAPLALGCALGEASGDGGFWTVWGALRR